MQESACNKDYCEDVREGRWIPREPNGDEKNEGYGQP